MRKAYITAHWALTLLTAPIMSQANYYFFGKNPHQVVGLLEVYPITLLFSVVFSLPTLFIYMLCFYFLSKRDVNLILSKFILIAISVSGIFITQTIINGTMSRDIIVAYSVTSIVTGLILSLRKNNPKTGANTILA